jgi:molybdopterin-guanine dinucleotide biosynthesis protein A
LAAIILSGGENSRMGRNKAFLIFKGRPFLWIMIEALAPLFREIILVTREPHLYTGFPVEVASDLFPERGPLTGLISGLAASEDRYNFCVGCDMPFIKTELVQYMMHMASGLDALIPTTQINSDDNIERPEPLHAVYDQRCLPVMQRYLHQGRRSLQDVIRSLNVRYLPEAEAARFDPRLQSFWSINTREEYRSLQMNVAGTTGEGAANSG